MKTLLLLSAILAVTACLPVPKDQEREKRSASNSDSDEFPSRIPFPPYGYPFGTYPPFLNQGNPWYYYYYYYHYPLFPLPFTPPPTADP
ncbi:follicular dendritic cell secreted peptide [Mus pahari]|uniref:follicular dendritic cell secreted peptide n=1 Tax=Mus pahari TaxID=10093 RepID=UPI000A30C5D8|nr:follicular dendritic cell secreted peptide [Mus pahari]